MSQFNQQRIATLERDISDVRARLADIERGYDRLLERLVALVGLSDEGLPRFTPLADAVPLADAPEWLLKAAREGGDDADNR